MQRTNKIRSLTLGSLVIAAALFLAATFLHTRANRPRIGVTVPIKKKLNLESIALYVAVWLAGGRPVILTSANEDDTKNLQGLLLGGGTDVFPGWFQKEPKADYTYDQPRDSMEIKWLKEVSHQQLPVLAICRGAQLMNIAHGGNLHMDISKVYDQAHYPDNVLHYLTYRKPILIDKTSLLYAALEEQRTTVNSLHKQSIDRLGEGLVVTAKEPNGIIQAIENPQKAFYMGVQFHPELLIYRRDIRRLFARFIAEARRQLSSKKQEAMMPRKLPQQA